MKRFEDQTDSKKDVIGYVYQTTDYDLFKIDKLNRPIIESHAHDLVDKLKNDQDIVLEPIIVDSNYKIIDGQHRFYALSALGMPINYIVDNSISIDDAVILNSQQRNWSMSNYINYFANKGNKEYIKLDEKLKLYGEITFPSAITATYAKRYIPSTDHTKSRDLKKGTYQIWNSLELVHDNFLKFVGNLKSNTWVNSGLIPPKIVKGLLPWYEHEKVSKRRLNDVLTKTWFQNSKSLDGASNISLAVAKAYNKGLSTERIESYLDERGVFHMIGWEESIRNLGGVINRGS